MEINVTYFVLPDRAEYQMSPTEGLIQKLLKRDTSGPVFPKKRLKYISWLY